MKTNDLTKLAEALNSAGFEIKSIEETHETNSSARLARALATVQSGTTVDSYVIRIVPKGTDEL